MMIIIITIITWWTIASIAMVVAWKLIRYIHERGSHVSPSR